jgi:hypothetical protein
VGSNGDAITDRAADTIGMSAVTPLDNDTGYTIGNQRDYSFERQWTAPISSGEDNASCSSIDCGT